MTKHDDGSWSYTCKIPNGKNFGIRQMNGDNQDVIKKIKIAKNMLIYFVKNHKSKKVPK